MTVVLKLGGSLLTEKTERETLDRTTLDRVVDDLGRTAAGDLVLVHGGGSFGHPAAGTHGVSRTEGTNDPGAIADVGAAMGRLNEAVVTALQESGLRPVGLSPRPLAYKDELGETQVSAGAVSALLSEGFLPVLYGDLVAHRGSGCTVLDGDRLAVKLADALEAERIGLCADVPGVLDADGRVIPKITRYGDVSELIDEPPGTDVTGGLGSKIEALLGGSIPAAVFGIEQLPEFLAGELPGTRVGDSSA